MIDLESALPMLLPRPAVDPVFVDELLARIMRSRPWPTLVERFEPAHRRLYYVGSAVMGAAALALGVALGRRRVRVHRGERAA
jgi:hypothetical protein